MKIALVLMLALGTVGGCMSEMGGEPPFVPDPVVNPPQPIIPPSTPPASRSVVGSWVNLFTSDVGTSFTFTAAGRYASILVRLQTLQSGDVEAEAGTYRLVTDPDRIVFTPLESTCGKPIPAYNVGYGWNGTYMVIKFADAIVSYEPSNSMSDETFTSWLGCFATDGSRAFTRMPLVAI